MKNKTVAVWLTFIAGPLGLHRIYLKGHMDSVGWMLPLPTLLGLYGVYRARDIGLDDTVSWLLIPLLGLSMAACALTAIVYGLMDTEKWNRAYNQTIDAPAGQTGWLTVAGIVVSLFIGTTVLLSTIAFSFQRYFEYEQEMSHSGQQSEAAKKSAD
jgi:TM2 domain-containing membrane protein YozV